MIGHPYVVTAGIIRFILRIFLNSWLSGPVFRFGEYPYRLPGIDRSVEAILITGFLLIGRNCRTVCSEKRAEPDCGAIVRTYRKLGELERRPERLSNINPQRD